jgi:hypothetical protein
LTLPAPLSHKVERAPRRRSACARRVGAYRQRQRRGEVVLKVVVPEHPIAAFLISSGRLSAEAALDRHQVEAAIAEVITDLAGRWLPHKM